MPKPRAQTFTFALLEWYRKNKRDLPWRRTTDPYRIWISEVMLQQTTVKAVLGYYEKWLKQFPTVRDLAQANGEAVLKAWQGLGYYNRARNLHKAAKILIRDHQGEVPRSPSELSNLPGFGPYTTGAVLSIAYGVPVPIIDANIRRVFMRLFAIRGKVDAALDKKILLHISKLLPMNCPGDFNQGLMELGALICRPREPFCNLCPVSKFCKAYEKGLQEIIPRPKVVMLRHIKAVVAVIRGLNGKILIQKRPPTGLLADLWEFPGGKVRAGESCQKALQHEIKEELRASVVIYQRVCRVSHYYTQFKVDLMAFECRIMGELKLRKRMRWVGTQELCQYPMPSGSAKIVEALKKSI